MKTTIVNILIAIAIVCFVLFYNFLGQNDRIEQANDVNEYQLKRGRTVFLIGLQGLAPTSHGHGSETLIPAHLQPVFKNVAEFTKDAKASLSFYYDFPQDTSATSFFVYMATEDHEDLGAELLKRGWAQIDPSHEHPKAGEYKKLQDQAQANSLGIWQVPEKPEPYEDLPEEQRDMNW